MATKKSKPAAKKSPVKAKAKVASPKKAALSKPAAAASLAKAGKGPKAVKVLPRPMASAPPHRDGFLGPVPDKTFPRASKLPPEQHHLTKREMEQMLTVGPVRGVAGEGSLKGKLLVHDGFPYLEVIGRDNRELVFLLQGPDQEVLPAYMEHRVSVSGLIRRSTNYGGVVDVRKYAAKKIEEPVVVEESEVRLKYLSPGEIEQVSSPGMGAGMKGFVTIRGILEMTGDEFFIVVSNGGTRHQVSFALKGKNAKGLKKFVGNTLLVTGIIEKHSGFGGTIEVELFEPRPSPERVARSGLDVVEVNGNASNPNPVRVKVNHGLLIRLPERVGCTWAVESTIAKRVSMREVTFMENAGASGGREFFFTPRNPGEHEIEFFLAKAFNPLQVQKSVKISVIVE